MTKEPDENVNEDQEDVGPGGQWKRRRERFCQEYVLDYNGSEACKRAGYKDSRSAATACGLLKRQDVIHRIAELEKDRFAAAKITRDKITNELANIAFADPGDFVTWKDGVITLKDSVTLTREQRSAVAEIGHTIHGIKIKFHKKESALETLARAASMLTDNLKLTDPNGNSPFPRKMVVEVIHTKGNPPDDGIPNTTVEAPGPAKVPDDGNGNQ